MYQSIVFIIFLCKVSLKKGGIFIKHINNLLFFMKKLTLILNDIYSNIMMKFDKKELREILAENHEITQEKIQELQEKINFLKQEEQRIDSMLKQGFYSLKQENEKGQI